MPAAKPLLVGVFPTRDAFVGIAESICIGILRAVRRHPELQPLFHGSVRMGTIGMFHAFSELSAAQGLIAVGPYDPGRFPEVEALGLPLVWTLDGPGVTGVGTDDSALCEIALAHLRDQGYAHLAWYAGRYPNARLARRSALLRERHPQVHQLAEDLGRLASSRPLGVWCGGDILARSLMKKLPVRIPEDIGILGCDDDRLLCYSVEPTISSIDLDGEAIGEAAVLMLLDLLEGRTPTEPLLVAPRGIVARDSTRLHAATDPLERALDFMRQHLSEDLRLADIISVSGLSRSALQSRFQSRFGSSIIKQLQTLRIQAAQELLAQSRLPVAVIGRQVGLPDPSHFSRLFTSITGTNPSSWRERAAGDG
ncbi:MAG: substrate-binding domain-containing protein [Planctomycetota bacterium]